jgi:hypothetical protein
MNGSDAGVPPVVGGAASEARMDPRADLVSTRALRDAVSEDRAGPPWTSGRPRRRGSSPARARGRGAGGRAAWRLVR